MQPGGSHESGAVGTKLGGGTQRNLLVGNEVGRLYLLQGEHLEFMTADEVKNIGINLIHFLAFHILEKNKWNLLLF